MQTIWQLAYHLSGLTMLAKTELEPLGVLPVPLRSAVLKQASQLFPREFEIETSKELLLYTQGEYEWVRRWRLHSPTLQKLLLGTQTTTRLTYTSVDEYCRKHDLLERKGEKDEHYAERAFLKEAFVPAFGLHGLSFLTPQAPFRDREGHERRIDFLLDTGTRYALEVEGRTFHSSTNQDAERFDDEKLRQRELALQGFQYLPFSIPDIRSGRAAAVLSDLIADDPVLFNLLRNRLKSVETIENTIDIHQLELLLSHLPRKFQDYQRAALTLFEQTSGKKEIHLLDLEPELPLLPLALIDIASLVARVGELYNRPVILPNLVIDVYNPREHALYQSLLAAYPLSNSDFPDAPQISIKVRYVEQPADKYTFVFSDGSQRDSHPNTILTSQMGRFTAKFLSKVHDPPDEDTHPVNFERHLIDYFARRFFTVPEVKPAQAQLIQRALQGQSGLGILPTGFGKSLVFQLYALMVPQTTLVISPLKALIRDQLHSMHRLGLTCVESITGADSAAQKDKKLTDFRARKQRLLYIAPERLQIKAFYDELRDSMETTPVGAVVVDEAHCVSEWGHDFRPAYLQIGHLRSMLAKASGRKLPLLAMTATASELVRKDITNVLELPEDSVIQLSSSDRPTLSLSVHPTASKDKPAQLKDLLTKTLPAVLKIREDELIPLGSEAPYKHAGVVFAIYANAHGRHTLSEGVHSIAKTISESVVFDPSLVRVHASTAPSVCPECQSPLWIPMTSRERKEEGSASKQAVNKCLECGHVFTRHQTVSGWDKTISDTQDEFQGNAFPFLVATKGYGMGIDKRNLRFIVHHALSSGLEGYYQEAGRAGRDGAHAHIALIYAPPTCDCQAELRKKPMPPCVTEPRNFTFYKCPHGLESLCDYGKQARFIKSAYAGVEKDVEAVMTVYDALMAGNTLETNDKASDEEGKETQLALYRLQQLGVVEGYSLKYKSLTRIEYTVDFDSEWNMKDVLDELSNLLQRYKTSSQIAEKALQALQPKDGSGKRRRVGGAISSQRQDLERAVTILMNRIYETIPQMRVEMLKNELDYATTTDCRRIILRSRFDVAPPGDGYKCGFCDVCQPDLKFRRKSAAIPIHDAQVEEVSRLLPELMTTFEPQDLNTVVNTAVTRGAVGGLYARAASRLEGDATNLSALYLSGALARRRPGKTEEAMRHLKHGYREGVIQGLAPVGLLSFSHEVSMIDPHEGFGLLVDVAGPFDSEEALPLVEQEATQLFGAEARETRVIHSVRKLRKVSRATDQVVPALQSSARSLLDGFDDMQDLLKDVI